MPRGSTTPVARRDLLSENTLPPPAAPSWSPGRLTSELNARPFATGSPGKKRKADGATSPSAPAPAAVAPVLDFESMLQRMNQLNIDRDKTMFHQINTTFMANQAAQREFNANSLATQTKFNEDFAVRLNEAASTTDASFGALKHEVEQIKASADSKTDLAEEVRRQCSAMAPSSSSGLEKASFKAEILKNLQKSHPPVALPLPALQNKFIPRRIFLKGWSGFGEEMERGLSEKQCKELTARLIFFVPIDIRSMIKEDKGVWAESFKNRSITIELKQDCASDGAFVLTRAINDCIKEQGFAINGRNIWAQCDAEEWKKTRNGKMGKGKAVLIQELQIGADIEIKMDWASGCLYLIGLGKESQAGRWDRQRGWIWCDKGLKLFFPDADVSSLDLAMNL